MCARFPSDDRERCFHYCLYRCHGISSNDYLVMSRLSAQSHRCRLKHDTAGSLTMAFVRSRQQSGAA